VLEQIADGEAMVKVRMPDGTESVSTISPAISDRIRALDLLAQVRSRDLEGALDRGDPREAYLHDRGDPPDPAPAPSQADRTNRL
jgi:hypothetical protein